MRQLPTGEPMWDLQFDEHGRLTGPASHHFLTETSAAGVTDLYVFSHGWGTSQQAARGLYDQMFPMIRDAAQSQPRLGELGFAGIYWPSLWFPPTPATPPRAAGAAQQAADGAPAALSAGTAALSGAEIAAALAPGFEGQAQQDSLAQIGKLIDEGEAAIGSGEPDAAKQQRLDQISKLIKSLMPPAGDSGYEDAGETALLLTDNPADAYQAAADAFGSAPPAGAEQGVASVLDKAISGAKDVLRVFSYNSMKARAGTVGQTGLGPLLAELHSRLPEVRVHLIGHSFGARLVSFALSGVGAPADSPVASLLLLQGAFSHWSFAHAQDNPFEVPGALNAYGDRVHGPLVATHSVYDWAVGVWYPKASFLARQDQSAAVADRWGGMGADGFQAVEPAQDLAMPRHGGTNYKFAPGTYYRIDAASVINNTVGEPFSGAHSDIRKPPVAQLVVAASAAHA